MTTSSRSTSRRASPRTRRSAGPGRRCSAGWPRRASGSPRRACHERKGIVQRLDVGTSGVMVVALSERAYTVLKRAFKERTVEKRYHALVQGHPDPSSGTIDAPIGRHRGQRLEVRRHRGRPAQHHPLRHRRGASVAASLLDVAPGNRPHPPDPGALLRAAPPVLRRPDLRRRSDAGEKAWAGTAMAARAVAGVRASRRRPARRDHQPVSGRPAARARRAAPPRPVTGETAPVRTAVRRRRLRLVGAVPGVLPAAAARRVARGAGPPHRVECVVPDGRGPRRGAPARRPAQASAGARGCCWRRRRR